MNDTDWTKYWPIASALCALVAAGQAAASGADAFQVVALALIWAIIGPPLAVLSAVAVGFGAVAGGAILLLAAAGALLGGGIGAFVGAAANGYQGMIEAAQMGAVCGSVGLPFLAMAGGDNK